MNACKVRGFAVLAAIGFFLTAHSDIQAALGDFSITRSDIIYDSSVSLNPSVVKASNGDLICCFQETGDAAAGGHLKFIRSTDNGDTWTTTPYLVMTSQNGQWGSIGGYLSKAPNGNIVLALMDVLAVGGHSNYTSDIKIYISTDNGQTFPGPAVIVPTNSTELESLSVGVEFLANGDWILPGYIRRVTAPYDVPCGFWRSTDGGATWGAFETAFADPLPNQTSRKYFNEVSIIQRKNNSLLAVARTDQDSSGFAYANGQLYYCESSDNGHTWTTPQLMGIPGHSPALVSWFDGTIMLGCRRLSATGNWTSVYIAANGVNFQYAFDAIDPRSNRTSATGYPTFAKLSPNDIYIAYYAGDSTLPWADQTYCAGNVIHYAALTTCGSHGYLIADINLDCKVDLRDIAMLCYNWSLSTDAAHAGSIDCSGGTNPRCQ
jgi:hypothetical protein